MAPYFAFPFKYAPGIQDFQKSNKSKKKKKKTRSRSRGRRRDEPIKLEHSDINDGERSEESSDSPADDSQESDRSFSPLPGGGDIKSLTAAQVKQYETAGLPTDKKIPPPPFPHAPERPRKTRSSSRRSNDNRTRSKSSRKSQHPRDDEFHGLHETQLSVLTTILHRCLLERDFQRAGRAWGILLRSSYRGHRFDVRTHNRWGIGAEILLRRDSSSVNDIQTQENAPDDDSGDSDDEGESDEDGEQGHRLDQGLPQSIFTAEGFIAAREYYNELITRYPYRGIGGQNKKNPFAKNIHLAMLSLWIAETVDRSKRARENLGAPDPTYTHQLESEDSTDEGEHAGGADSGANLDRSEITERTIKENELSGARDIGKKLEEMLRDPFFDQDVDVLHLKKGVSAWVRDLEMATSSGSAVDEEIIIASPSHGPPPNQEPESHAPA